MDLSTPFPPENLHKAWLARYTEPGNNLLTVQPPRRHWLRIGGFSIPQTRIRSHAGVAKALTCWGVSHSLFPLPRFLRRFLPPLANVSVTLPRGRQHRLHRQWFKKIVNPAAVQALRQILTPLADQLMQEAAATGQPVEFSGITDALTYEAICIILGINDEFRSPAHRQRFFGWLDEMMAASSPFSMPRPQGMDAFFNAFIDNRLERKLNEPIDQLLRDRRFKRHELIEQVLFIFVSATVTTSLAIASAVAGAVSLRGTQQFKDIQSAALSGKHKKLVDLYLEALRFAGPSRLRPLVVYWWVRIDGKLFWPLQILEICFPSANRDPKVFKDPNMFNPDRTKLSEILVFGAGENNDDDSYLCPGRGHSSVVAVAALTAWFRHFGDWEISALEFRGNLVLRPYLVLCPPPLPSAQ